MTFDEFTTFTVRLSFQTALEVRLAAASYDIGHGGATDADDYLHDLCMEAWDARVNDLEAWRCENDEHKDSRGVIRHLALAEHLIAEAAGWALANPFDPEAAAATKAALAAEAAEASQ